MRGIPELATKYKKMDSKMRKEYVKSDEFKGFFESTQICGGCKNTCCAIAPCSYSANDFDFSEKFAFEKLREHIDMGKTSIHAVRNMHHKLEFQLSARTEGTPIVVRGVQHGECSQLTADGCAYTFDHRPTLAVLVIPKGEPWVLCNSIIDKKYNRAQWLKPARQTILHKLYRHFDGGRSSG